MISERQGKNPIPQAVPLKGQNFVHTVQTSLSLPREKSEAGSFLLIVRSCTGGERLWLEGAMKFFTSFDVAGFVLTWSTRAFYLVSGFLTSRIGPWTAVESVSLWEKGGGVSGFLLYHIAQKQFIFIL